MADKNFYITTTLPYVNADPHIGFAMEIVRADAVARWKKLGGFEVFFNTGTDEHGQKIFEKAREEGEDTQSYVDGKAERFKELLPALGILPEAHFIRTTDEHHVSSAQEFWKRCEEAGDIYKKNYTVKYCVGCELEKTDSELEDGKCTIHPHLELEVRDEENYFFRFSKYGEKLLELYRDKPDFVVPDFRFNEIKAFVERGLEDFSISRLREKMAWGVPVPGDEEHVMYVWFDALTNYISTLGWPRHAEASAGAGQDLFEKFWKNGTPTQYCGKDNLRQQSAMWQAMLMSAGLPSSEKVVINGFITSGGQKMSKSLGNTIDPFEVVEKYGKDALRYFVLRELSTFEDSDFTPERFAEAYNANLANGLGNLTSRIMKLAETHLDAKDRPLHDYKGLSFAIHEKLSDFMANFELQKAMNHIWAEVGELDREIQEKKPWETKDKELIQSLVEKLAHIGHSLAPFLPDTSEKILIAIENNKLEKSLFPRMEANS